jgi:inner membrane protein
MTFNESKPQSPNQLPPLVKKIAIIVIMTLCFLWPLSQVGDQIQSRQQNETVAQKEIAKSWGQDVLVTSPVFWLENESWPAVEGKTNVVVDSLEKKRGVFKVPVFSAVVNQKFKFQLPLDVIDKLRKSEPKDKPRKMFFSIEVYPNSALQDFEFKSEHPESLKGRLSSLGLQFEVSEADLSWINKNEIEIELKVRGTGRVLYESLFERDLVHFKGNWEKPQYYDELLPSDSKLDASGFEATWNLSNIKKWDSSEKSSKKVGINHLWISTDYSMVERALKYGILLIALSFLMGILVEVIAKIQIHPMQYGLIGLALSLFYLLLLSISEVTGFDVAYLIATAATIGLIAFYMRGFIKNTKHVLMLAGEQLGMSVFFYVLLTLEERALLAGAIGLFLALAALMSLTRRIDWSTEFGKQVGRTQDSV